MKSKKTLKAVREFFVIRDRVVDDVSGQVMAELEVAIEQMFKFGADGLVERAGTESYREGAKAATEYIKKEVIESFREIRDRFNVERVRE